MAAPFGSLAAQISAEIDFEFEKAVIAAVKSCRCLYDRHSANYNAVNHNEFAWNNIAKLLKRSVIECMDKWFSLVHTFFYHQNMRKLNHSTEPINWPHFESLLEIDGIMAIKYMQLIQYKPTYTFCVPVESQRDQLITDLIYHRSDLLNPKTTIEQAHRIWARIAYRLNTHGVALPIIRWQKYWWDMKLEFARRMSYMQRSLEICKGKNITEHFREDEIRILEFCGVKTTDSIASISAVMWSNVEFGNDLTKILRTCKKCATILSDMIKIDYCETCSKDSNKYCDLCSKTHEQPSKVYQIKDWSEKAKNVLPNGFQSFSELSMCLECSNNVKRKASKAWMVCRVCERQQLLDYLFRDVNDQLRNAFKEATCVEFSEFDGLPAYICKMCKVQMQQFNNFYLRFNRTQTRLQSFHGTQFIPEDAPANEQMSCFNSSAEVAESTKTSMPPPPPSSRSSNTNTPVNPKTYLLNPELPLKVTATPPISTITREQARGTPKFASDKIIKRVMSSTPHQPTAKRVCIAPTNTLGVVSLQTLTSGTFSQNPTPRNISTLPTGHTPVPLFAKHTGVTIAKRICATQPAVFKINQSTKSPTMFCIAKAETIVNPLIGTENPILNGLPNNPPQSTAITQPTIKIENTKDDYPTAVTQPKLSKMSTEAPRKSVKMADNQKNITTARLNDSTKIVGQNSPDLSTSPAILPYTFQSEFLAANVFAPRNGKIIPPHLNKLLPKKSNEQQQDQQHKTQRQQQAPTNTRMRKYWGPVDEFQITSVAEKTQILNPNQTTPDSQNSVQHASTTAPSRVRPPVLEVKIEDDQPDQSMFYPDSFELNKVSLDVDVSLMLNTMIRNDIPLNTARNTDNFSVTYIDESSKEHNGSKKNGHGKNKNDNAVKNKRDKTDDKPEDIQKPAEVNKPHKTVPKPSKPEPAPMKKVHVQIKRSDRLKKLASSVKPPIATRLRRRRKLSRTAKQKNVMK